MAEICLKVSKHTVSDICFFGLIFLLNPLIAVFLSGIYVATYKKDKNFPLKLWIIIISAWISLVNLSKIPAGDQPMYQFWYENISYYPTFTSLFKYAGPHTIKEPVYGLYQYITHLIFAGTLKPFWFLTSFIGYCCLLQSVRIILLKANLDWKSVMFGIVCCVFFNQYFYTTLHLLRQVLAFSLVLYSIALRIQDNRIHWIPLVCGPLVHTTAGLFAVLSLIPYIYHRMNLKQSMSLLIPLLLVTVGSVAFGGFMTSILGEDSGVGYAFNRLSTSVTDGLDSNPVIVAIMVAPLTFISIINLVRLKRGGDRTFNSPLYPILYLFIFLAIFILSMSARPLIQYRFVFITYQMLPFIVPLLFTVKSPWRDPYFLIFGLAFTIRFFTTLPYSQFSYMITTFDMLVWPAPYYFYAI